jgi:hypothetical protein
MNFTESRWLPIVLLTGMNLFLPFVCAVTLAI